MYQLNKKAGQKMLSEKNGKAAGFVALVTLFFTCLFGCIEPFSPPEVNSDENYLVVDGFLNVGGDTSVIQLRRSQNINVTEIPVIESGATLRVESEKGETYSLTEKSKGVYVLAPQAYNQLTKYRLRIKTKGGNEYLSDFVTVKQTPPVDSLSYRIDEGQNTVVISVNTHDPTNNTRFYRWKFEETFEYRAAYYSAMEKDIPNREIILRKDDINRCWRTDKSTSIMLGSTIKLSQDIIRALPLNVADIATNKFYLKYSILVKQYGLSQDAFEYWTSLAKTTQGTGSLFDPLPSQVTGNIKNTANNKELVFGYFSASVEQTKRIFINKALGRFPRCDPPDTLSMFDRKIFTSDGLLISYFGIQSDSVLITNPSCADCRLQGGTTKKPDFWE